MFQGCVGLQGPRGEVSDLFISARGAQPATWVLAADGVHAAQPCSSPLVAAPLDGALQLLSASSNSAPLQVSAIPSCLAAATAQHAKCLQSTKCCT